MKKTTSVLIGLVMIIILVLILVWRAGDARLFETSSSQGQPKIKIAEYISIPY